MTEHDELPIPDYDHLPTGSLPHRVRTLDEAALERLLAYERAHAIGCRCCSPSISSQTRTRVPRPAGQR